MKCAGIKLSTQLLVQGTFQWNLPLFSVTILRCSEVCGSSNVFLLGA